MNKIKYSINAMAALALCAMSFSCSNEMDNWGVDASFDRLFSTTSLSVTPEDTKAAVEFDKVPNATMYQVHLSTDSLYDDVDTTAIANFRSCFLTTTPDTLRDLVGDTYYFLRIRACGDDNKCSHWRYYLTSSGKGTFHTKAEQIMNAVGDDDRTESTIRVTWTPNAAVTHLVLKPGLNDEDSLKVILADDVIAKGEYTFTGLDASTSYTISIYKDQAKRGSVTASTFAAAPAGQVTYRMQEGENITSALMKQLAEQGAAFGDNYSVTIVVPGGANINMVGTAEDGTAASLKIPDGMSVTFFGGPGNVPVINLPKSVNIAGKHAYVKFQNLEFVDGGCQYLINQSADANVETLTFQDCYFHDFERSIVRTQSADISIGKIVVDNCIGRNLSTGNGYSVFQIGDAKNTVGEISISNSTFDTAQRSFIECSKTCVPSINISNSTLYNIIASARYFIDANGQNSNITLTNVILGKTYDPAQASRGVRTTGEVVAEGCIRTSDCIFAANDFKAAVGLPVGDKASTEYFTDPDNHDFTLKVDVKCGDPRWYYISE